MRIKDVKSIEILDSRGYPTLSTKIVLDSGVWAKGEVPSGASTGDTEVLELRDGDKGRYRGKGVLKAVDTVNNQIKKEIVGRDFKSQEEFDKFLIDMDGTKLKTNLGGNSILSLSMAFCRATALEMGILLYEYFAKIYTNDRYDKDFFKLPNPLILVMEGGLHGNWATDFQEYMVVPDEFRFPNFKEKFRAGAEIFHAMHDILVEKKYSANVGFEGAYAPSELQSNKEAFDIIMEGIERAGYKPYIDFRLAIDVAASEFYDDEKEKYVLKREGLELTRTEWLEKQLEWFNEYPIFSVEDTFDQEDWVGWQYLMRNSGDKYQVVGDDLLTTNVERITKGINLKAMNAVLIKLNQIGSVTETIDAIRLTHKSGMKAVISHRGGETNDDMIADLVVGTGSSQSKFGGPDRGERLAKYNRLLEIESEIK
ncbi:MAG TPA: phosphopyruvate hydratase [Candidatus Dojkabacteria bacterium]|nr:phosphopyruvate hydratase [Candidatus Dojkabacteria bacterium]